MQGRDIVAEAAKFEAPRGRYSRRPQRKLGVLIGHAPPAPVPSLCIPAAGREYKGSEGTKKGPAGPILLRLAPWATVMPPLTGLEGARR